MIEFSQLTPTCAVVRFGKRLSLDDVQGLVAQVRDMLEKAETPAVFTVDCRAVQLFAPVISRALIDLMKSDNPQIKQTGVLLSDGAAFSLQVGRMLREADNPLRSPFPTMDALLRWQQGVLDAALIPKIRAQLDAPLPE